LDGVCLPLGVLNLNFSLTGFHRLSSRVSGLVALCVLVLMSWQGGVWLAQSFEQPVAPALPDLQPLAVEQTAAPKPVLLWGEVPLAPVRQSPVTKPAPPPVVTESAVRATRLNVKLLGVIDSKPVGVAIIQVGRDVKVLSVGEQLQPNVTLVEIGGNFVILQNRGQRERLDMDDPTSELITSAAAVAEETPPQAPINEVASNALDQLAPEQTEQLLAVSREVRQNPMKIGQYVRFEPMRERDEWLGIRIGARNHPEIFRGLGFQEGDMVTSINGLTIAEMADNPAVWNRFLQESRFSLVVNRNGLDQTIDVDLSQ
jgi:general secretion pathway protein C